MLFNGRVAGISGILAGARATLGALAGAVSAGIGAGAWLALTWAGPACLHSPRCPAGPLCCWPVCWSVSVPVLAMAAPAVTVFAAWGGFSLRSIVATLIFMGQASSPSSSLIICCTELIAEVADKFVCGPAVRAGDGHLRHGGSRPVTGFLDLAGAWDPSLAFVMGGALLVFMPGYFLLVKPRRRVCWGEPIVAVPTPVLDRRLIGGAALFGIGWGLVGICPGQP